MISAKSRIISFFVAIFMNGVKPPVTGGFSCDLNMLSPCKAALWVFFLWPALSVGQTQPGTVLCRDGNANFDAELRTGVKLHVGAARVGMGGTGTLATRACAARLSWDKQELLVATGASELDLDAFGVDLGDGVPVAAFQVKKSDTDCCVDYAIYSLEKPPRLLRTVKGGGFFSASDVDLDGNVEVWTDDALGVYGFEGLSLAELVAPTVVFRFAHGKLVDVSSEFRPYFDKEIDKIKAAIHPQDLENFRNSGGQAAAEPDTSTPERLHQLRAVKIKVLEIVWSYLYSGREEEAWKALAEMWPRADAERIRSALIKARAAGIQSQADSRSSGPSMAKRKQAHVFDVSLPGMGHRLEVVSPKEILLELPPIAGSAVVGGHEAAPGSELLLDLVIDAAGKVRSVTSAGRVEWADPDQLKLASSWKFIPAYKDGRPVACRMRLAVSPKQ